MPMPRFSNGRHEGIEKAIKSLLEADGADSKKKCEPYKTNPFSVPALCFDLY